MNQTGVGMERLYGYQREGVDFLKVRKRAYLADEMGLGKSAQVVTAVAELNLDPSRVLIVCPASVQANWANEWCLWYPSPTALQPTIVSYNKLDRVDPARGWALVVFDEAHYLKTPGAQRTRRATLLARAAERVWMLSGTPVPNNAVELYAPMRMLIPAEIRSMGIQTKFQWMNVFCQWVQTQYGVRITGVKNVERLRALIKPVFLRRRQAQVLAQLPPLRIDHVRLEYDAAFANGLTQYVSDGMLDPLARPNDPHVARLRRYIGEWKVQPVIQLLTEELYDDPTKKLVIIAHHRNVIDDLYAAFNAFGAVVLDGSTSQRRRAENIDKFQKDPRCRVFIGQNTAAGVGINLTAASDIVLVEPPWSPEDMMQVIKRIHRIGQDAPCRARVYSCPGTLDEQVMGTLVNKARMIDATIN